MWWRRRPARPRPWRKIGAQAHDGTPFELALLDLQMPEMDGYEATRRIRALGHCLPIVAMTAEAMAGDSERCLDAGMDYVAKPIEPDMLRRKLDQYLG